MADPGSPDWWLDRLYKRLRERAPKIRRWDDWYVGNHPLPEGYEKAGPLLQRLYEATGLNILAAVTNAAHERMQVEGFKVGGKVNDDVWDIWQGNNFDASSSQVFLEKMALSEAYTLTDPNLNSAGVPTVTPEHPEQCIVEFQPGSGTARAAGLKVWRDDLGATPTVRAMVYLPDMVVAYAAPTRISNVSVDTNLAMRPAWEMQPDESGRNPLGEVPLVPFSNRARMLKEPLPEFQPALSVQKRIMKTLLDRMAMQDAGAFKAKWATGLEIPRDPETGEPVEPFQSAVDRMFVNENEAGRFGQFEAEDIKQMLEAVEADVKHAAVLVPTPPDQILGQMVNVGAEGLKMAQASLISRVRGHHRTDEEPLETTARLMLKAGGKDVPNVSSMTTVWHNPEYRTENELADALTKARSFGVPDEALWERWGATPQEISRWRDMVAAQDARGLTAGLKALDGAPPSQP